MRFSKLIYTINTSPGNPVCPANSKKKEPNKIPIVSLQTNPVFSFLFVRGNVVRGHIPPPGPADWQALRDGCNFGCSNHFYSNFLYDQMRCCSKEPPRGVRLLQPVKGAVSEWAEDRREDPSRNFHDRSTALKFKFARRNLRTDPSPHNAGGKWGKINETHFYSLLSGSG